MVSVSMSSIIGSNAVSSALCSTSRIHPTPTWLMTNWINDSENGLQTQPISVHHSQPKLHEVYYARHVGIPSGRVCPLPLGISTRLIGLGRYVPVFSCS